MSTFQMIVVGKTIEDRKLVSHKDRIEDLLNLIPTYMYSNTVNQILIYEIYDEKLTKLRLTIMPYAAK